MASFVLLAICFGLIVYKAYKYMFFKPPNFPPGPPRLPFIGAYLFILLINYKHIQLAIDWVCKYYKSNILGFYMGPFLSVVANDSSSVKEVMLNKQMDGRPDLFLAQLRDPNHVTRGLFFTQGLYWRDNRRFALRYLRDFGFGRRFMEFELDIEDELKQLIEMIKNGPKYSHERELYQDGMVLCPKVLYTMCSNAFLKVLCNERIPRENQEKLLRAADHAYEFSSKGDSYGRLLSLMPWIVKIFPNLSGYKEIRKAASGQYDFMKTLIDEQFQSYDESHERHFLDIYFKEMKTKQRNKQFQHSDFGYDQLIMTCTDFLMPATVNTAFVVVFYLRQMILNPDIKERVQDEIDKVVGRSRLPTLDDRSKMPYTEASIREILRYETVVPNGVPHVAMDSTKLSQYDIPMNCVVVTGLRAAHLDSTRWNDPNTFQPERFLDNEGKLNLKNDHSVPFGAGKRLCVGETHSRNLLFLLITTILQNFDVSVPDVSKFARETDIQTGLIAFTSNVLIKFDSR